MAIATEQLPRLDYALSQQGTIYSKTYTLAAEALSNAILLPVSEIHAIGIQTSPGSDLSIYATMASPAEIEAETAIWDLWDGASLFNNAVTAIYAENNSTTVAGTFTLTVRGEL